MRNILIYLSIMYHGDYYKIMNAIKNKDVLDLAEVEKVKNKNILALTCCDDGYPEKLKQIMYPPLVMFYEGDISLINKDNGIGIVGALEPSEYGLMATKKIIKDLAPTKKIIVAPFDRGIGQFALKVGLENNLKVIALLPGGKNLFNKQENFELYQKIKNNGLILTEYYDDTKPTKESFISRFRILSGLSSCLIVGEGQEKSGVESAISFSLEQGKNVFAIPFPILSSNYNNRLIEEGASPLFEGKDIENLSF